MTHQIMHQRGPGRGLIKVEAVSVIYCTSGHSVMYGAGN